MPFVVEVSSFSFGVLRAESLADVLDSVALTALLVGLLTVQRSAEVTEIVLRLMLKSF